MKSLFPHQKLDWMISRLEAADAPDAAPLSVGHELEGGHELARALVSRGVFHDGGEVDCSKALAHTRKALGEDPGDVLALALSGLALLGMQRARAAERYLQQASEGDPEVPELYVALGLYEQQQGDHGTAVRHLERACRLAPDAWETHLLLGRTLMVLALHQGHPQRLVERGQFHLVQALKRDPSPDQLPPLLKDLGVSCMLTSRYREAEKFFIRLREHEQHSALARHYLGQVAYELGKYNNAIQHFRGYLRERPEDARVLARMAMAWFQLGDYTRAREACSQALLVDPESVAARYALGCTLLEQGEPNEAIKVFRDALRDHPEHLQCYIELVRTRRVAGDSRWLVQALETEVGHFDRLPPGGKVDARQVTRERIRIVLEELKQVGPSTTDDVLGVIDRTQDEGLRFQLWEAACAMARSTVADVAAARLRDAATHYGPELGGLALTTAEALPEPVLTRGLSLADTDLKRAAVDRYGPAHDVAEHRRNIDHERSRARAYQALLLLSVGLRRSAAGKELLRRWADDADEELAAAAWIGLAMYGEPEATRKLQSLGRDRNAGPVVQRLVDCVTPPAARPKPRRVSDGEQTRCTTCGRQPGEVTHMMAGGDVVICDVCVMKIRQNRTTMPAPDAATCSLCGRTHFEASGLFAYNDACICSTCLQLSMGLLEREEVDRFLATW